MTPMQRHLATTIAVLAGLSVSMPGLAQEPAGKVMMPWQKPQPQPRPAPDMKEILPWLLGDETAGQGAATDGSAWVAKLDDPILPDEPVVVEPAMMGPRLETGTIVPSGLVLKKPVPVVHAAAAASPPANSETATTGSDEKSAPPVATPTAANATPAVDTAPGSAATTTQAGQAANLTGNAAAETTATKDAGAAAPDASPATKPEAANAAEIAPALPEAEEVPAIPEPLPDPVVTPVAKTAKTEAIAAPVSGRAAVAEPLPSGKPNPPKRLAEGANAAQQYCFNIADAAKDARYAWQKKTLADVEAELKKRIALLDERTAEYQTWLARRDEFIRNAEEGVVKIYSGMKPDTAASQLALMNEETAAAVLVKLNTRNASAILNEMDAAKASRLTSIITGAAKLKRKKQLERDAAAAAAGPADSAEGGASKGQAPAATSDGGRS